MRLPAARGAVSELVFEVLRGAPGNLPPDLGEAFREIGDAISDEDLQIFLFVCYELHYHGWDDVADRWEWDPALLALRGAAEAAFEVSLRRLVGRPPDGIEQDLPRALAALVAADGGPSLATELSRQVELARFREFVMHRSVYHLKEADAHTWGIPRLHGPAKAALVEIQVDEYGGGQLDRMHAQLFRDTMAWLKLDTEYGAYVNAVPAVTLAINNLMSLFGLHRRWRGALLGHLAAFEMTSSLPNRRYGDALRRLGGTPAATRFYDEHVEADAVHEQIAAHDLCGSLVTAEPRLGADVWFGAACCLTLDRLFAEYVITAWSDGRSSLSPSPTLT